MKDKIICYKEPKIKFNNIEPFQYNKSSSRPTTNPTISDRKPPSNRDNIESIQDNMNFYKSFLKRLNEDNDKDKATHSSNNKKKISKSTNNMIKLIPRMKGNNNNNNVNRTQGNITPICRSRFGSGSNNNNNNNKEVIEKNKKGSEVTVNEYVKADKDEETQRKKNTGSVINGNVGINWKQNEMKSDNNNNNKVNNNVSNEKVKIIESSNIINAIVNNERNNNKQMQMQLKQKTNHKCTIRTLICCLN